MKKRVVVVIAVVLSLALVVSGVGVAFAGKDLKGNGVPNGPHYNLNIIGMQDIGTKDGVDCGNGHRIFVQLNGKSKIMLTEYDEAEHPSEFCVLDCVATQSSPAEFVLPNPDPDNTGTTLYSVYLRVLGKPNGYIIMDTCATDPLTGEEVCSDLKVIEVRDSPAHGKNKFNNVSKELLYIYAWVCVDYDLITEVCLEYEYMRLPLFSEELEDYLWQYDNHGVRIAQLRFYPGVQTTVPEPGAVPVLLAVTPNSGDQDTTLIVTITGVNLSEPTAADFGDRITVKQLTYVNPTTITAAISIKFNAPLGLRNVSVTLESGKYTLPDAFTVTPAP